MIDLGIAIFGRQFFDETYISIRNFFLSSDYQTFRHKIEKFICSNWFLNDSKKIRMNTYRFDIRGFLVEDSPLFLGTYISLALLVGGRGVLFTEEKVVPKLVIIPSSLSILVES